MKIRIAWVAAALLGSWACANSDHNPALNGVSTQAGAPTVCVDRDKDGFGENCQAGADCDDHDPGLHQACLRCAQPNLGCDCARGTSPVQCFGDKTQSPEGVVMCNEGTRFCRDGRWSD